MHRVFVDTSVWVTHFRKGSVDLRGLLQEQRVCVHPYVIGELSLGNLRQRQATLQLLRMLPQAVMASDLEINAMEQHRLHGSGIGWIDAALLASASLSAATLWTSDRRLRACAERIGLESYR